MLSHRKRKAVVDCHGCGCGDGQCRSCDLETFHPKFLANKFTAPRRIKSARFQAFRNDPVDCDGCGCGQSRCKSCWLSDVSSDDEMLDPALRASPKHTPKQTPMSIKTNVAADTSIMSPTLQLRTAAFAIASAQEQEPESQQELDAVSKFTSRPIFFNENG
ncbi:hypothetical protein LTS18_011800, partial [Coniosporium uncinatum]